MEKVEEGLNYLREYNKQNSRIETDNQLADLYSGRNAEQLTTIEDDIRKSGRK